MLLDYNQNKYNLTGMYSVISNTNQIIYTTNIFNFDKQSVFINDNSIFTANKNQNLQAYTNYKKVYNTKIVEDVYDENHENTNNVNNFPAITLHAGYWQNVGGGYFDYNGDNLVEIAATISSTNNFIYGSNFISTGKELKWQTINSYSKIIKSRNC